MEHNNEKNKEQKFDKMEYVKFNIVNFLLATGELLDNALTDSMRRDSREVAYVALRLAKLNNVTNEQLSDLLCTIFLKNHTSYTKNRDSFASLLYHQTLDRFCEEIIDVSEFIVSNVDTRTTSLYRLCVNRDHFETILEEARFDPILCENFLYLNELESFWYELLDKDRLGYCILDMIDDTTRIVSYQDLIAFIRNIETIIYSYTQRVMGIDIDTHIRSIALLYGFDKKDSYRFEIALRLSNLGTLGLEREFFITTGEPKGITQKKPLIPYYTKRYLGGVFGFDDIAKLASCGYEKINGEGYPLHLFEAELGLKERLFAILFLYRALREKRPYRKSFTKEEAFGILFVLGDDQSLDPILLKDFYELEVGSSL